MRRTTRTRQCGTTNTPISGPEVVATYTTAGIPIDPTDRHALVLQVDAHTTSSPFPLPRLVIGDPAVARHLAMQLLDGAERLEEANHRERAHPWTT